ncbi:GDP-mannose 4,6-dehydratase [soil metagenome]
MRKALITGLGGFTGRYLAEQLQSRGYEIAGLEAFAQPAGAYEMHVCNLNDRKGLADVVARVQPDVVAHLAAISFVAHGDADEIYRTNVAGTRNLLEALAGAPRKPGSVLLASSANIYGNALVDPITEDTPASPANDYAVSKLAMEYMARLWAGQLPITIVRPFNYTGVGQSPNFLIPKIVDHFRSGAAGIELGNIEVARDFSDVRTVAAIYARLLELAPAGQVFNVCSGRAITLQQVLDMMQALTGRSMEVAINPAFVRANEVKTLRGSQDKLAAVVGELERPAFEQTLQWMLEAP